MEAMSFDSILAARSRKRAKQLIADEAFYGTIGDEKTTCQEIIGGFCDYTAVVLARGQHFHERLVKGISCNVSENEQASALCHMIDEIVLATALEALSLAGINGEHAEQIAHAVVGGDYDLQQAERLRIIAAEPEAKLSCTAMTGAEYVEFLGGSASANAVYRLASDVFPDPRLWPEVHDLIAKAIDDGRLSVCYQCKFLNHSGLDCEICSYAANADHDKSTNFEAMLEADLYDCGPDCGHSQLSANVEHGLMSHRIGRAVELVGNNKWLDECADDLLGYRRLQDIRSRGCSTLGDIMAALRSRPTSARTIRKAA